VDESGSAAIHRASARDCHNVKSTVRAGRFCADAPLDEPRLKWMLLLHLTFIVSGVLFAVMDWVAGVTDDSKDKARASAGVD